MQQLAQNPPPVLSTPMTPTFPTSLLCRALGQVLMGRGSGQPEKCGALVGAL